MARHLTVSLRRQVLGVEDADDEFADYRPRFNIAPTDQHFIVTSQFERLKAQPVPLCNSSRRVLRIDRPEGQAPAAMDPSARRRPDAFRRPL
jgi:hypothetical protein